MAETAKARRIKGVRNQIRHNNSVPATFLFDATFFFDLCFFGRPRRAGLRRSFRPGQHNRVSWRTELNSYPNKSMIGFPEVSVREMLLESWGLLMGMSRAW